MIPAGSWRKRSTRTVEAVIEEYLGRALYLLGLKRVDIEGLRGDDWRAYRELMDALPTREG